MKYKEIQLGQKIHNPSFPKIPILFPQIATSLFNNIQITKIQRYLKTSKMKHTLGFTSEADVDPELAKEKLREMGLNTYRKYSKIIHKYLPSTEVDEIMNQVKRKIGDIDARKWAYIISKCLKYHSQATNSTSQLEITNSLFGVYTARVFTFWEGIQNLSAAESEQYTQVEAVTYARELRKFLNRTAHG